ncbi:hypothetical protein [Saliniradius amylolyticus]|uniref:hypothetical protein n=1 Tax=Saliniradius amylolyticus TaxID=2183582 RepID=UPI000D68856E|nr:hypothetical protein [Saliniradius amylolyticus]
MRPQSIALIASINLLASTTASALPDQCIEGPSRSEPCPNLIYKRVDEISTGLADDKGIICLCLTDFKPLLKQPESEQERINQEMQLQQMEALYNIEADRLLELARY